MIIWCIAFGMVNWAQRRESVFFSIVIVIVFLLAAIDYNYDYDYDYEKERGARLAKS